MIFFEYYFWAVFLGFYFIRLLMLSISILLRGLTKGLYTDGECLYEVSILLVNGGVK